MHQTKKEIQKLLGRAGIRPLRRYGQNFLIDGNLMRKIVDEAGITQNDVVLEVGPGTGGLTQWLLERAGGVVAVEVDRGLHAILTTRFASASRLTLLHQDALASKSHIAAEIWQALDDAAQTLPARRMLVANLPYQVATPLLADLLLADMLVSPLCFTVQAEVGDRFAAEPGSKAYGPVSVLVQVLGEVRRIAKLPPEAFWPVPKVDSVMLRIDVKDKPPAPLRESLHRTVHACFNHRRKTLRWSLLKACGPDMLGRIQAAGRWDLSLRPEQLSPAQWRDLAAFLIDG